MSREPEHVAAARDEAERGGASFSFVIESRKITGQISLGDRSRKLFMSKTPSDRRAVMNIRKNVRDYIKEMKG